LVLLVFLKVFAREDFFSEMRTIAKPALSWDQKIAQISQIERFLPEEPKRAGYQAGSIRVWV